MGSWQSLTAKMCFLSRMHMPCCAMSWVYSCLPLIIINMIVDRVLGHRAILKSKPSTITYKNKSNLYNWHKDTKFSPLVAWVWADQFTFWTWGWHRYVLTYCHQLTECSVSDVSPGIEAEAGSQRRMWSLNPYGCLSSGQNVTFLSYLTPLFTCY